MGVDGDQPKLHYKDAQFDSYDQCGCYFHDYWTLVMSEVKRVLKPSGQFVLMSLDPEKPSFSYRLGSFGTYLGA